MRGMLRWLLLPWHAAALLTGSKDYKGNPLIGSVALNRRGLHVARARLAERMTQWRRRRLAARIAPAERAQFEEQGFVQRGDVLPPAQFTTLLAELRGLRVPMREMREGDAITRRVIVTPELLAGLPALRALLESPAWRDTLRYVAGSAAEPLVYVQTILSHAAPAAEADPQTALHMDTFHPNMKAWFYLQDVAAEVGPLAYVPGSHRLTPRRLAWERARSVIAAKGRVGGAFRVTEAELPRLRLPPPRRLAVPANTLVVADVRGFHARSRTEQASMRVEIYAISRPNPYLPLLRGPADWWPALARRRARLHLLLHDALARLSLARPVWHEARAGSPFDPPEGKPAP